MSETNYEEEEDAEETEYAEDSSAFEFTSGGESYELEEELLEETAKSDNLSDAFEHVTLSQVPSLTEIETPLTPGFHRRASVSDLPEMKLTTKIQTVIFRLSCQKTFTRTFKLSSKIGEIIDVLAKIFLIPFNSILLLKGGKLVDHNLSLLHLKEKGQEDLEFEVKLKDETALNEINIDESPAGLEYQPEVKTFETRVECNPQVFKTLTVHVTRLDFVKEWLGGYRNKKTGQIYYNARTETTPGYNTLVRKHPERYRTREAQTHYPLVTVGTQVGADKATQMSRTDIYIPTLEDKIIEPRPYITHAEIEAKLDLHSKAIIIQKMARKFIHRQRIAREEMRRREVEEIEKREMIKIEIAMYKKRQETAISISYPSTIGDFYKLYAVVSSWYTEEYGKIVKTKFGTARKAAMYELLMNEIEVFKKIEKQRVKSKEESLKRQDLLFLENASRPYVVRYEGGYATAIDTLKTQRARELKEVYSSYVRTELSMAERMDVLLHFKQLLESYKAIDKTYEMITLIEREMDLIKMQVTSEYLVWLRRRIEDLFFNFIRDPEFNPQVEIYRKTMDCKTKQDVYRCHYCCKILPPSKYLIHARLSQFWHCRSCEWIFTVSRKCKNLIPYMNILMKLCESEAEKCSKSSLCFLIQPLGIWFLTQIIWQGHSIISQSTVIQRFKFSRWNNHYDWAPWNCILLTEEEAVVHEKIDNPESVYHEMFVRKVRNKHILSRIHFSALFETDTYLRESGVWGNVNDKGFWTADLHHKLLTYSKDDFFRPSYLMYKEPEIVTKIYK